MPSNQKSARNSQHQLDNPQKIRGLIRKNELTGSTAGFAPGFIQCNLLILAARYADEFSAYCEKNPKVCPIISRSGPGEYSVPDLGHDLDLRTDLGGYSIFERGKAVQEATSIKNIWQDDFVSFAYGCSFSFEYALLEEGVDLAYLHRGQREALYITNIDTTPHGRFAGQIVASMRPFRPSDAIKAILVTKKYPLVHGAPIHVALPHLIGVDLKKPYQTLGPVELADDEIPLFWACGVTPQLALINADLPICITHKSAHMLITDIPLSQFSEES